MKFRVKYWLILCGANLMLALIGAAAHATYVTPLSFIIGIACWYMASYLLGKEKE